MSILFRRGCQPSATAKWDRRQEAVHSLPWSITEASDILDSTLDPTDEEDMMSVIDIVGGSKRGAHVNS